jgi:peptidyl-prolyl cis-trans isomerase SurA
MRLTFTPLLRLFCAALFTLVASHQLAAQGLRSAASAGSKIGLNVSPELLVAPDRSVDFIVALVDNEPITNHDVRMMLQRMREQAQQAGANSADVSANEALELLIYERSQLQWAKETGLRIADDELQSMAESVANRNQMTLDNLYRAIERQGVDRKRFLQNLREQQILQRLRDREVPGRIKITEAEVDRALAQQKATLAQRAGVELAQILVAVPENASPEQIAQADQTARQWRAEIDRGADFFMLARQRSQSPDRMQGGSMGMRPLDRYPELFIQATQDTPEGGVVGPVRSGAGFHLLKVVKRQQAGTLTMPQTHVRHILLKPGGDLTPGAARARLAEFKSQIDRGQADFAQLARMHSQDGSAAQGGDLGWASAGDMVPEFEQVMDSLRPGQVSEPIVSRYGVHLVQVLERREVPLTESQERQYARNLLREGKYEETLDTWARDIRGKFYIEYREPPQ